MCFIGIPVKVAGLPKQRHLPYPLGAVVLVGAGVGLEAMLARGGVGLAVAEDVLHGGDVMGYLAVLFFQFFGEVNNIKPIIML